MNKRYKYRTTLYVAIRGFFLLMAITLYLGVVSVPTANSVAQKESNRYAVNLVSSEKPIELSSLPPIKEFDTFRVYKTEVRKKGKVFYRLRLGFFATQKDARKVLTSVRKKYPEAWVTKVSLLEREGVATKTTVQGST
ncbi:MAG: SPOR domain-containing protein, partial [Zetaproteobacteria bacterium]|nr:SPOR domain-containing protein [Zetaproteobacteria bacterium]